MSNRQRACKISMVYLSGLQYIDDIKTQVVCCAAQEAGAPHTPRLY